MTKPQASKSDVLARIEGMTPRDWFAGQALPAWIAVLSARERPGHTDFDIANEAAGLAGFTADAMLAERERGQGDDTER